MGIVCSNGRHHELARVPESAADQKIVLIDEDLAEVQPWKPGGLKWQRKVAGAARKEARCETSKGKQKTPNDEG